MAPPPTPVAATSSSSTDTGSATAGVSRLERLFTLLSTSSTSSTRSLAARQLAEVVRTHPEEMDVILQHLHPILRNKQWETRMAATDAITEIMKQIKVEAREKREEVKIKAEGAVVQKFDLDSFDLESVLARSGEMKASRGEEFFEAETSAASQEDQRKALNQRLGLDMAAKLGVATDDIFSYDDLKQSASPPPTQAKASEAQGRPMSSRERNKLKRALSKQQRNTIAASKKIKMAPKLYKADRSRLESGEWPLRDFCLGLRKDLFDETWEIRHGAATAVREIVRLQGSGAGIRAGVDAVEAERSRSLWLQDMGLCLVVVIAKDRFGDFVSDQVVAPVRESCAQALGSVVDLMSEKEVQMIADILIKLLKEEDWQCRHGGLLAIKYLLATRCDLASKLLNFLYPSIFLGLQDAVDDVVGVAASALVPVVSNLIFSPSIDVAPLTARLWDALRTLDDLTSSTHSVMHLLSELLRLQSDEYPEKLETPDASLAELVSRLFPFLSHSSTLVRKAALNTLDTVTSRLDLAEIFLPAVIQALSSHLFQRALLEHHEPNLFLIERIWNNVCDFTPLGPLLMSTCPLYGTWVTLITQPPNWPLPPSLLLVRQGEDREPEAQYLGGPEAAHIVDPVEKDKFQTRARWLGAKMLGKLAGFIVQPVPGMDYSKDVMPPMEMFVTKILLPHLQTYSAHRRAAMALVVTEWCNQHETSEVPDSLKLLLYTFLIESPNYDETIQALNVLRTETTDFVSTLKHYKLQIPAVLIKSSPQDLGLEDLRSGLADQNYDQLFAHTKVKKSILRGLIERKEGLAQSITSIISEHNLLSVMTLATTAGAVIGIGALTDKLNPVIKPLMESLKMERNEQLQSQAALMLAKILDICITRGMMAPVDKVVKNLVNFVSSDAISLPQFVDDPTAAENSVILTLKIREMQSAKKPKKSGASASKASESSAETGKSSSDNGPQTAADAAVRNEKSRGARIALETIVRHFHDQVFVRIPKLHDLTLGAVTAWNTAVGTQLIADFGFCLRAFEVVIPVVSSSLYPSLAAALTNLVLLLCNEHSNVRHLAARCIGELSKIQPVAVMTCVINSVIPLLASDRFKHRQGVIECLACIVDKMEMDIIPYIVLLIVPVLGRMSDHNESVRLLATNTFATLIRLIPLDGTVPMPADLPKELLQKKMEEEKFIEQLMNAKNLEDYVMPVSVKAELRSYQRVGIKWLAFLNRYQLHGILCDDMGLGKTLQTICMLASDHHYKRKGGVEMSTLIVCPPTLCRHWQGEIVKFVGSSELRPLLYSGPAAVRAVIYKEFHRHNVIISSYDVVRNDIEILLKTHWNYVVLDEGHIIKNGKTKTTQAIKQLRSDHRLILSGTPIQNSVLELWSLFDYLMPGFLGTEKQFTAKYSRPIVSSRDSKCSARDQEAGALAMEALHRQVLPFILRRMKEDVLKDLPPKITQDYYCDLSPIQVKIYEDFTRSKSHMFDESGASGEGAKAAAGSPQKAHVFQALQYLRKVCNHPKLVVDREHREFASVQAMLRASNSNMDDISHAAKLPALRDLLLQCGIGAPDSGNANIVVQHRALIFFQLKSMMDIVERDLLQKVMPSVSYLRLDGSVPVFDRQGIVDRFNSDVSIDALLISSAVGGMGLNLTGADTVIFVENDWNPMKDLQAMDRAHRIGQKKVVNVYRLITRNTIEEKIMCLQKFKLKTANTVISSDNGSLHSMATDSILDLFSLEEPSDFQETGELDESESTGPPRKRATGGGGGASGGGGGSSFKELLEEMPELWDEKQYEAEYDINNFMTRTKSEKS